MIEIQYFPLNTLVKRVKVGFVGSIDDYYCDKDNGVRLYRTTNLTDGGLSDNDVKYVTYDFHQRNKKSQLHRNDILIARHGDNGKSCVFENDFPAQALNVVIIEPDLKKMSPYLLRYMLESEYVKRQIQGAVGGSVQGVVNTDTIANLSIPIISNIDYLVVEQFLTNIDAKVANNNAICSDLEAMAKLLYDYWFVQFDFPDENGKPYKSSGGKMVWNEELKREIPEGWEVTSIGDITICHDSERIPVANKDREAMKGDIPYYGATGIMGYVNKAIFSGDYVLLAEDGSVMDDKGHPIIQRVSGDVWINNHAHVLEPTKGYACRLLMMVLKDIPVIQIKTGSIQMKINQENLNRYKVVAIPKNLLKAANKKLNLIDEKLLSLERENQQLASLRDFLLPMLMNGQVKIRREKEI